MVFRRGILPCRRLRNNNDLATDLQDSDVGAGTELIGGIRRAELVQEPIAAIGSLATVTQLGLARPAIEAGLPGDALTFIEEVIEDLSIRAWKHPRAVVIGCRFV